MEVWLVGVGVMVFSAAVIEIFRRVNKKVTRDEAHEQGVSEKELNERGLL